MDLQLSRLHKTPFTDVDRLVVFLNKTEGRDKVTKALQCGSRLLAWVSSSSKISEKFTAIYRASSDSRKLFRLGKFINEYMELLKIAAAKTPESDIEKRIQFFQAICRTSYLFYWLTDNFLILSKLKIINRNSQTLAKISGTFWLLALLAGMYCEVLRMRAAAAAAAQQQKGEDTPDAGKDAEAAELQLQHRRRGLQLNLLKQCCDVPAAANLAGVTPMLLRRNFSDGFVGATGLLSALISCKQLY